MATAMRIDGEWLSARSIPIAFTLHGAACCASLYFVGLYYAYIPAISFTYVDPVYAVFAFALFLVSIALFGISRFSFGYFVGFYLYTIAFGYLAILGSSTFRYNHWEAAVSIILSAIAFLLPATIILPIKLWPEISASAFQRVLSAILIGGAIVVVTCATSHFKLVGIREIYEFRDQVDFPWWLRYPIGILSTALLPFAFAAFFLSNQKWKAGAALVLLIAFYPITLTKMALFSPAWLIFLAVLSGYLPSRLVVIASLLLPLIAGLASALLVQVGLLAREPINLLFAIVNFRMIAIPSIALDFYNDFFSSHAHTMFCQISLLKSVMDCPYTAPLSVVFSEKYHFGNLNASLLATEGIASVGLVGAPFAALACGVVVAFGNSLCKGLPDRFVILSGGVLVSIFMNVPFTTIFLTHGAALIFILWSISPRSVFEDHQ
jgi:hypothetical protein